MLEAVFRYCERGTATGAFAEPVNTLSNVAFLLVAISLWQSRRHARDAAIAFGTAVVAVGSTTLHMAAQRWAELADVVPIGIVMALLTWAVLVEVVGLSRQGSAIALVVALASIACAALAMSVAGCDRPLVVHTAGRNLLQPLPAGCLNGGWAYVPAALGLGLAGGAASWRGRAGRRWVVAAACMFATGLAARTLDLEWCPSGAHATLHALWHVAAAVTVYCLGRALKAASPERAAGQASA